MILPKKWNNRELKINMGPNVKKFLPLRKISDNQFVQATFKKITTSLLKYFPK